MFCIAHFKEKLFIIILSRNRRLDHKPWFCLYVAFRKYRDQIFPEIVIRLYLKLLSAVIQQIKIHFSCPHAPAGHRHGVLIAVAVFNIIFQSAFPYAQFSG